MYNWLQVQAQHLPDKPAVIFDGETVTFSQLYSKSLDLKGHMASLNRRRIGLFIGNTMDAVHIIHAAILANIEVVLINTRLTAREIGQQLDDIGVDTVVATEPLELEGYDVHGIKDLWNKIAVPDQQSSLSGDSVLSIMFTSGTTGRAKAVPQTFRNHHASALGCEERFGYSEESIWMNVNPVYHISGFSVLLRSVIRGCTMVLVEKFEENAVWDTITEYKVTHTSMVPVMLGRLLDQPLPAHELEGVLLGGAGVTREVLSRALDAGLPVYNSFGMTETCSQVVSIAHDDPNILEGTVGQPLGNIELRIDESNDGELLVRGAPVTQGYLNAEIEMSDGYFRTGDMGYIDENGYLYILDRRKDLIISGGENVYPKEIEDVVITIPEVANAAVVKRKDAKWGEVPILLVEEKAGMEIGDDEIMNHLDGRLARYKLPKEIHRMAHIIMTSTGKVSRVQNQKVYDAKKKQ
ncbi:o-succinylbenzoate--CoA ligase [Salinicoccus hispanicus]|uniref:2-succinylbenzoate--CoA ligase n=1 Tax=Salinicoccus hispanicus TaxID=157225 RepID=A0A6N8TY30_9STAP|nr:o-succinylbenzoate--CoA ligase [Salinicoccus hispanicus]MXQ50543.1 o-succinylbenzoate--CoA ligase [Salinicoccus hispanicus]